MPPKKNINKAREPVSSTTKSLGTRRVKKNNVSSKRIYTKDVDITKTHNSEHALSKLCNKETQKKTQDDLLSKRDINIMLANEVLKTQFPSKMPILDAIEHAIVEKIDVPKNVFKKIKKVPIKQKATVNKKNLKRSIDSNIKKKTKVLNKCSLSNQETCSNTTEQEDINEALSKVETMKVRQICKLHLKKKLTQNYELNEDKPDYVQPTHEKKVVSKRGRPKKHEIEGKCTTEEKKTENPAEIMKSPLPAKRRKVITNNISRSSSSSDLSWTRDISSCSTSCVSVSSNDFVLIDNKLPVIKLKNINPKPAPKSLENTLTQTTQSPRKSEENIDEELCNVKVNEELCQRIELEVPDGELVPPVLSSPSSSSSSSSSSSFSENTSCVSSNVINDLLTKLRSIDLEVITWVGFNNINISSTPKLDQFKEKLQNCNVLLEERNLLKQFKTVRQQLHKYSKNDVNAGSEESKTNSQEDNTFVKPRVSLTNHKGQVLQTEDTPEKPAQSSDATVTQNISSNSAALNNSSKCHDDNDDDDALSLYAESITGLDSSRRSGSIQRVPDAGPHDEYKPEYATKTSKVPVTFYNPSRIEITHEPKEDTQTVHNNIVPAVCEKQNADSTSINRELENDVNTTKNVTLFEDRRGNVDESNFNANLHNSSKRLYPNQMRMVTQNYKATPGSRSSVFTFCHFNLESRCLHKMCKFNHIKPSREEIERKVSALDEPSFIAEYMLTREMRAFRRMYGICLVTDCIRRKLTRLLIEMVIDFVSRGDYNNPEDVALTTDVVERTLMYLNDVDLNVCRDLFTYKFARFKGLLLCDYFMKFIAESPNFTRFVPIFIKLTYYITGMDLRFDIEVSILLLERVCILPYEEKLARALIEVIKNTNDSIFYNYMIEKFEKILAVSNKGLYDSFAFLKNRKILNQTIANGNGFLEKDVRYSPDTTNLDNVNKTMEPKLTRAIGNKVSSMFATNLTDKNPFQEDWNIPSSSRCAKPSVFGLSGLRQPVKSSFPKSLDLQSGYKRFLDSPFAGNPPNKIRRTIHTENFKRDNMSLLSNSSSGSEDRGLGVRRGSPYRGKGPMFLRRDNGHQFRNIRKSDGSRFF